MSFLGRSGITVISYQEAGSEETARLGRRVLQRQGRGEEYPKRLA